MDLGQGLGQARQAVPGTFFFGQPLVYPVGTAGPRHVAHDPGHQTLDARGRHVSNAAVHGSYAASFGWAVTHLFDGRIREFPTAVPAPASGHAVKQIGRSLLQLIQQIGPVEPDHARPVLAVVRDRLNPREPPAAEHPPRLLQPHHDGQPARPGFGRTVLAGPRQTPERAPVLVADRQVRQEVQYPPATGGRQLAAQHGAHTARTGDRVARFHR